MDKKQTLLLPILTVAVYLLLLTEAAFAVLSTVSAPNVKFGIRTDGSCPTTVKVQQNFALKKYLSRWYEHSRLPNSFEAGLECVTADYGKFKGDSQNIRASPTITVVNRGIEVDGQIYEINGTGRIPDKLEPAKLLFKFDAGPEGNYWVLGTDYRTYSAVWSCETIAPGQRMEGAWILTRSRNVTEDVVLRAFKSLNRETGIKREDLKVTRQTGCE